MSTVVNLNFSYLFSSLKTLTCETVFPRFSRWMTFLENFSFEPWSSLELKGSTLRLPRGKPIYTMLHSQAQLFLVWFLVEYKSYSTGPSSLQHYVFQSFSVCTVMPLRKICTTICPFRGKVNLDIVHTSAAFKSRKKDTKLHCLDYKLAIIHAPYFR